MKPLLATFPSSATPDRVWAVASDFLHAAENITAITRLEILTPGPIGAGTRFREWRGRQVADMEISAWSPPRSYGLLGYAMGTEFASEIRCVPDGAGTRLEMQITVRPQTLGAKLLSPLMAVMSRVMMKGCTQDLRDIAAVAERSSQPVNASPSERPSDQELVVTRDFNAPRELVFRAWSDAELFRRWWVPKSAPITLVSCEMDVRTGGSYTLVFAHPDAPEPMPFFGRYLEVLPPSRMVWTNEEAGEAGQVTTVTFEAHGDRTRVVVHDRYPSKAALDEAIATGGTTCSRETFSQLDAELSSLIGD